jgi:type IV pilus assembly protein PilP
MSRTHLIALLALVLAAPLAAQTPTPPTEASPAAPADPNAAGAAAPDSIRSILDQELQAAPGAYTYNPQGRRDPFVSLQKPVEADNKTSGKRPGLEGMLIQEVALKGIVRTPRGYTAMMQGTDGKSYFVLGGQRLADGVVTAIDAATVTFRQDVSDPLSTVKTREIKKSLYQSEEAR